MTKQYLLLSILLLLTIALTGCASLEAEAEHLEPLNRAAWPTLEPAAPATSPTPFPQVKVVATSTPTSLTVAPATATPALVAEVSPIANAVAQVNSGLYAPVAAAFVTADDATVYRQPGTAVVGAIEKGELVGVLGQNAAGDWLYVLSPAQVQGWLPKTALRVTGTLEQAPVLPPDPLAVAATPAPISPEPTVVVESPGGQLTTDDGQLTRAEGPLWADNGLVTNDQAPKLPPITYGLITISAVNLRQGPSVDYAKLDTLKLGQTVDVLATNLYQDWVLVQTGQLTGWVSLPYIDLFDPDKVLPVVSSNSTEQENAGSKIVPPATQPGEESEPTPSSTPAVQDQGQSDEAALSPLTTAKISGDKIEIRPGPDAAFAPIDELTDPQQPLSVLAVDPSRKWVLVQPASAHTGWVALSDLTIAGTLDNAPQIFTAWVVSNGIEVRSGPGIFHDQTGRLAINSLVRVLGLDDGRSWALIRPIPGGSLGWSQLQFLKNVGQPWANVPKAPDLPAPPQVAEVVSEPFTPARPISESKIVFQRSSGGDIMVINPDGTGLRRLTSGIDPVLSPDGQTVAFTRWEQGEAGRGSLWLIDVDGNNERSILGFIDKQPKGPDWSPDGSQIVLNFQHEGRLEEKSVCHDVSGGVPGPPRNAYDFGVSLDPAKGDVDFCWKIPPDPHWSLRVVNVADGSFEDIDGGTYAFRPAWDPAQPWRIVSDGGRGLLAADLNRDDRQNLTAEINDGSPVFSPDGRYIAMTTGKEGGDSGFNLYRLNADGSGRVQLTQTPLWVTSQPDQAKAWNNVAPAWSPDGSQIAFLTNRTGRWEIWLMNADGTNQQPMFSDEVNTQLQLAYNFVDERVLSWR